MKLQIIANGGIDCLQTANRCIQQTGASGVMCGEALLENPALFSDGRDVNGRPIKVVGNEGGS